jgi:CheY-like chemotaxis protein/cold shock CspA family protein
MPAKCRLNQRTKETAPGEDTTTALVLRLGHVPLATSGNAGALDQVVTWNPDLLLVDLTLPEIDGIELAKRIRQTPETASKPLIGITGYMDGAGRRQAVDAGFDAFLVRPFKLDELANILSRVEARIAASIARSEQTRNVAEATRVLNRKAQEGLDDYRRSNKSATFKELLERFEGSPPLVLTGFIASIDLDKKTGFISSAGRSDVFFYASCVANHRFAHLTVGQEVEFTLHDTASGRRRRARSVKPCRLGA